MPHDDQMIKNIAGALVDAVKGGGWRGRALEFDLVKMLSSWRDGNVSDDLFLVGVKRFATEMDQDSYALLGKIASLLNSIFIKQKVWDIEQEQWHWDWDDSGDHDSQTAIPNSECLKDLFACNGKEWSTSYLFMSNDETIENIAAEMLEYLQKNNASSDLIELVQSWRNPLDDNAFYSALNQWPEPYG